MQDTQTHRIAPAPQTRNVVRLDPSDTGSTDPSRAYQLFHGLSLTDTEDLIASATEELDVLFARIRAKHFDCNFGDLPDLGYEVAATAKHYGLDKIGKVAMDMINCARTHDPMALAAVVARLGRLVHRAPEHLWTARDAQ